MLALASITGTRSTLGAALVRFPLKLWLDPIHLAAVVSREQRPGCKALLHVSVGGVRLQFCRALKLRGDKSIHRLIKVSATCVRLAGNLQLLPTSTQEREFT